VLGHARRLVPLCICTGLAALGVAGAASPSASASEIHVPDDAPTLRIAIEQAAPGDTIVLSAGTYAGGNVVPREKHDITIRGVDRNEVVFDGADRRKNGIVVHADGVSILNVSAHNFLRNGFYWDGADRFRASYVTVWNVREYGVYVEDGEQGVVDNAYVSGAARAAYYVGECRPCRATISHVVAKLSAVGYSGTNATGVVIRDSIWDRNGAGIVPNTYANEALPPQARATIVRNTITNSGRARVPIRTALAGFVGIGIAIAGGNENTVSRNRVTGSQRYGIAVFPTARYVVFTPGAPEPGPPWRPRGNRVSRNVVTGSGRTDLALAQGSGVRNCFTANRAARTLPRGLQTRSCPGASSAGDPSVAAELTRPVRVMFERTISRRRPPSYASMPTPPPQPSMPGDATGS
jgi:parallel beta helix pectate lyase-like protein